MNNIWKKTTAMALLLALSLTSMAFAGDLQGRPTDGKSRPAIKRTIQPRKRVDLSGSIRASQSVGAFVEIPNGGTVTGDGRVYLQFVVKNEGNVTATFHYEVLVNSAGQTVLNPGHQYETVTLSPGQSRVIPFYFAPNAGRTDAQLWVDQLPPGSPPALELGQYAETNESNNYAHFHFFKM